MPEIVKKRAIANGGTEFVLICEVASRKLSDQELRISARGGATILWSSSTQIEPLIRLLSSLEVGPRYTVKSVFGQQPGFSQSDISDILQQMGSQGLIQLIEPQLS